MFINCLYSDNTIPSLEKTDKLNKLFLKWINQHESDEKSLFHADGIVDEETFNKEDKHILFVLAEPNAQKGKYAYLRGIDLRIIFSIIALGKEIDKNLGVWIRLLLSNDKKYKNLIQIKARDQLSELSPEEARDQLKRVAVMNLKKTSGTAKADYKKIKKYVEDFRESIVKEIGIIGPSIIIWCGNPAKIMWKKFFQNSVNIPSFGAFHPACRPKDTEKAFQSIVKIRRELTHLRRKQKTS